MSTEFRLLPCVLTDAEIQQKGEELAAEINMQALIDQRKAASAAFKEPIDEQKELIARLAKEVDDRSEQKEVEIEHVPDFVSGVMILRRSDTGERIDTRPLTDSERQVTLGVEIRETS